MSKILTINSGSSSLKFKLYEMPEEKAICSGICERIGNADSIFTIKYDGNKDTTYPVFANHEQAAKAVLDALISKNIIKSYDEIEVIGHRIVQGGKYYSSSVLIDQEVENNIAKLSALAPLHNPAHLVCLNAFKNVLKNVKHVAVFDTAFHQSMDEEDYIYPIPYELSEKYDIRRYGAHGTSHHYLSLEANKYLGENKRIITCHIGSGSSISAINNGKCIATSMGLTPLSGIMMGTRCGDIDPSIYNYLMNEVGLSNDEVFNLLNKKSGLLGVSGISNDSRDVLKAVSEGNPRAILANKLFVRRICDFIGQYYVRLGGCDLIVFSAGIGENEPRTRKAVCNNLSALGVVIDEEANANTRGTEAIISAPNSKIKLVVIPTDEEVMIARDAYRIGLGK